ncbi:MAG: insulinase family protein [Muribaculaceae bacterium]|nr:insulinase family protein [Muribaculaceae bacterium]
MAIDRSTPPPVSDFGDISLNVPEPITLSNGMKMWIASNREEEINKLSIYMTGGAFQESRPTQATACSIAVFNGNKEMNYAEIAEAIDFYGAWRSAQVFDNCTAFSLSSLNENFDKTLPIFIESLRTPVFPDNEFEPIRRQLAVSIATSREKVKYLANKEIMRLYYGKNHPLATDPTPDDINALTQKDMRSFHSSFYKAQNCNLVFAGNISDKEIATVETVLGEWLPDGEPTPQVESPFEPSDEMFKIVDKPGGVQAAIVMMLKTVPRRHPDYFKLRILATVLGGYFGSRLMKNIREDKGYTYGISANHSGRAFDGYVGIATECDTRHTWNVINETHNEIKRLHDELIPEQELETVKRFMLSDLVKTLDSPFNIAAYIGNMFCYGTYPTYFNEQVQEIRSVTSLQLQEIARKYLDISKLRTVIACDKNSLPATNQHGF